MPCHAPDIGMQHRGRNVSDMNARITGPGRLFYVMGASGAGKDSLIRFARERVGDAPVVFAHRYITRPADAGGEHHVAVTLAEFERLRKVGGFALSWEGNGLHYGIGVEIRTWLAHGLTVVMNGSRAHLDEASRQFPELFPVLIDVLPERLAERLRGRGRESDEQIRARIERARRLSHQFHPRLRVIRNDGRLEDAGTALLQLIATNANEASSTC